MNRTFNEFREISKPNKSHACAWCHEEIKKGESHLQFMGYWESEFQNWRIHHDCKKPMSQSSPYSDTGEICSGPHGRGWECEC
jgi:hypothetical protein